MAAGRVLQGRSQGVLTGARPLQDKAEQAAEVSSIQRAFEAEVSRRLLDDLQGAIKVPVDAGDA
jgi:hypothetical protein